MQRICDMSSNDCIEWFISSSSVLHNLWYLYIFSVFSKLSNYLGKVPNSGIFIHSNVTKLISNNWNWLDEINSEYTLSHAIINSCLYQTRNKCPSPWLIFWCKYNMNIPVVTWRRYIWSGIFPGYLSNVHTYKKMISYFMKLLR